MRHRLLLVGMSNSSTIYRAFTPTELEAVEYVNFQVTPEVVCEQTGKINTDLFPNTRPDLLVLSMGGSIHLGIGLINNPKPFAIGDPTLGRVPADPNRHFIPLDAMQEVFAQGLSSLFDKADQIHDIYRGVPSVYVQAPPPIADEAHLRTYANAFAEKLHLGISPPELRMALYQLQFRLYAQQAVRHKAGLLPAPAEALTPEGFLDLDFAAKDPGHGNPAYGRLVVDQIAAFAETIG